MRKAPLCLWMNATAGIEPENINLILMQIYLSVEIFNVCVYRSYIFVNLGSVYNTLRHNGIKMRCNVLVARCEAAYIFLISAYFCYITKRSCNIR